MGDRATLALIPHQPRPDAPIIPIYVFTHWHGGELPQRVAQGLHDGRNRWGEPSYMTRILLVAVMGGDFAEIDGFGVGLVPFGLPADAGRPLLVVDTRCQRAGFVAWDRPVSTALAYDYEAFIGEARWPQ